MTLAPAATRTARFIAVGAKNTTFAGFEFGIFFSLGQGSATKSIFYLLGGSLMARQRLMIDRDSQVQGNLRIESLDKMLVGSIGVGFVISVMAVISFSHIMILP